MNVKNGKCIRRLSFRALRAARKRNLIAVAAIILTTLLFTALFSVTMSINSSYETYQFRQIGGYNHGAFKEVTDEQAQAIAAHKNVKAVGARKVIGSVMDGGFSKTHAEISFMDENCTKWSYSQPEVGRIPQSGKEITMDTAVLKLLGIEPKLGAEFTLTYMAGTNEQLTYEKTDTFTLVGWWEYDDISPVHYINVSEDYANSAEAEGIAAGMPPFLTDLNVMMASSVNIRGQMEQVISDLGYNDAENGVRIGVNWGYTTSRIAESIDAETIVAAVALLLLIIFTGYLIIYNIFQISVTGDIRFYGLLKTIGVTPRQLRRIIRQQALMLCVVGIPVGLLLGYGIGAFLTPVVMAESAFGVVTVSASPLIFLGAALFALVTVLLSCARPGRIAAKVSPVEATKYTEVTQGKKKRRSTRGAKVYQMAFANLGRNKSKTILVVLSLSLSVVLLNVLVTFTGGFDMEKYLEKQTCADFIVSGADYFRLNQNAESYISRDIIGQIGKNTVQSVSGCGYTLVGAPPVCLMDENMLRSALSHDLSEDEIEGYLSTIRRKGDLVEGGALIEGLDQPLFEKLTVVKGDIAPLLRGDAGAVALAAETDDYGNPANLDGYPSVGSSLTVTYIDNAYYVDSRTGERCDDNTPEEFWKYYVAESHDVNYTVCAYVTVPSSMGLRHNIVGSYNLVLPFDRLAEDSEQPVIPLFYLFDTPDSEAEKDAERYLADLTSDEPTGLMYESKSTLRTEFESFQNMFLLLGGLLCAIIGLIGILNFFNAIMTGILSRKREFAVLQAVGMTNRQLKSMLIYEGLFYALSSSLAALILSLLLSPLAGSLLESMFWFFSANFTITPALIAVPVFVLLGGLIPSVMYRQSTKQSVVERLQEVE